LTSSKFIIVSSSTLFSKSSLEILSANNGLKFIRSKNENRKYSYLKFIKKTFRKMGVITFRSVVDLRRNIENTFKNESNYKNKHLKLKNLDEKKGSATRTSKIT
jgi:hypothetical protein